MRLGIKPTKPSSDKSSTECINMVSHDICIPLFLLQLCYVYLQSLQSLHIETVEFPASGFAHWAHYVGSTFRPGVRKGRSGKWRRTSVRPSHTCFGGLWMLGVVEARNGNNGQMTCRDSSALYTCFRHSLHNRYWMILVFRQILAYFDIGSSKIVEDPQIFGREKGTTSVGPDSAAGCPVTILLQEEFAAKHPHPPSPWVLSPRSGEGQIKTTSKSIQ